MTPRTRSRSSGQSLVMRRGDGGRFPMNHAEDVVHTRRRVIERHVDWLVLVEVVDVAGVCADLLLSYQRNSIGVIGGGNGGDEGGSRRF